MKHIIMNLGNRRFTTGEITLFIHSFKHLKLS